MTEIKPAVETGRTVEPFKTQLLKWIGNKQRFAHEIASFFPRDFCTYYEPFLGSGAVLGTLAPDRAVASDSFTPLIEIWQSLRESPETLKRWYRDRYDLLMSGDKVEGYEAIKAAFNAEPNAADLLFLARSCYGGVIRFRKADGYMSTPCGAHTPISPDSFSSRVDLWAGRTAGSTFVASDFEEVIDQAAQGDFVYCDPPYSHSQAIVYGAQGFSLDRLFRTMERAKERGVHLALSIDGTKKSGAITTDLPIPEGLFAREIFVNCGRSMLRRFQKGGETLEDEVVTDRLCLTY